MSTLAVIDSTALLGPHSPMMRLGRGPLAVSERLPARSGEVLARLDALVGLGGHVVLLGSLVRDGRIKQLSNGAREVLLDRAPAAEYEEGTSIGAITCELEYLRSVEFDTVLLLSATASRTARFVARDVAPRRLLAVDCAYGWLPGDRAHVLATLRPSSRPPMPIHPPDEESGEPF